MMKKISILCMSMAFIGMFLFNASAQEKNAPTPTLTTGMKAPGLEIGQWFKGKQVDEFQAGHVYVIEFWATWCGPCRAAMPHMSELARHYKNKVTFLGLNVWEHGKEAPEGDYYEKARNFTQRLGDGMDYTVAADGPSKFLEENWLKPAGIRGIPSSFIIDQKGDIVWIGHPMSIDAVLAHVVNGTYTEATKEQIKKDAAALREKDSEFRTKLKAYTDDKDYKNQLSLIDQMINANPANTNNYLPLKFKALLESNPKAAAKMASSLLKKQKGNPILLSSIANSILDSDKSNKALLKSATLMAKSVEARSMDKDYSANQLLGKAYFANGDAAKAVAAQQVVVDFLSAYPSSAQVDKMKADAAAVLEKYKAGK